jgi:putative glutamine amidotransferase
MLTGGDDLDPRKMGLSPHPSVTMIPERRELADRLLCKLVQQRRIPTLGIGLGMQELNVVSGGGIFLHLPEDMPRGIPHRDPQGGAHRHTVVMEAGTRLEEIYGPGEIRVNSYHHQGIRKLAPLFRTGALAPDGLIEAFEGKDPSWWVIGVQWHPENEGNISLDMQLIEAFTDAASSSWKKAPLTLAKAS